jgi:hypothetical protein
MLDNEPSPVAQLLSHVDPAALHLQRTERVGKIVELERQIEAIDDLLAIMDGLPVDGRRTAAPLTTEEVDYLQRRVKRPSLKASILTIMEMADEWSAELLLSQLTSYGLRPPGKTPRNSVAATLSRLADAKKVRRVRKGVYSLASATR